MNILRTLRKIKAIGLRRTLRGENIKIPITPDELKQGKVKRVYNSRNGLWE